jgi:ribulose 1,5-bisphosphate carboxylase large subunit-like protein
MQTESKLQTYKFPKPDENLVLQSLNEIKQRAEAYDQELKQAQAEMNKLRLYNSYRAVN